MIKVSDNLFLQPLTQADAPAIFNIIDGEREYMREWLPFVDFTHKVQDTEEAIEMLSDEDNPIFGIVYDNLVVGMIGFKETNTIIRKTEIGYWLSQYYQKKGIMTSAVTKLLGYAFEEMNMNRVIIKVAVENLKSRKIPKRIGFVQEGIERESDMLVGDVYTDIVVYSMLKREFIKK